MSSDQIRVKSGKSLKQKKRENKSGAVDPDSL